MRSVGPLALGMARFEVQVGVKLVVKLFHRWLVRLLASVPPITLACTHNELRPRGKNL